MGRAALVRLIQFNTRSHPPNSMLGNFYTQRATLNVNLRAIVVYNYYFAWIG
jgi:hypothetical protein